jgi:hypothetical protein
MRLLNLLVFVPVRAEMSSAGRYLNRYQYQAVYKPLEKILAPAFLFLSTSRERGRVLCY